MPGGSFERRTNAGADSTGLIFGSVWEGSKMK